MAELDDPTVTFTRLVPAPRFRYTLSRKHPVEYVQVTPTNVVALARMLKGIALNVGDWYVRQPGLLNAEWVIPDEEMRLDVPDFFFGFMPGEEVREDSLGTNLTLAEKYPRDTPVWVPPTHFDEDTQQHVVSNEDSEPGHVCHVEPEPDLDGDIVAMVRVNGYFKLINAAHLFLRSDDGSEVVAPIDE